MAGAQSPLVVGSSQPSAFAIKNAAARRQTDETDIMSRKDAIDSLFLKKQPATDRAAIDKSAVRVRAGAISAMGSSLQEMAEGAKAAARLQDQLAAGEAVVSLDPSTIDGSPIADRLPADVDPKFEQLEASISQEGQQVPILVRPHPETAGRYQIVYGRRRLRAALNLRREVSAIVRNLTDRELVVAQGRENLDRADLSFIEKALFALRLEDAGFDRSTIIAALSTDKADLSRYITVARGIPLTLAAQIGPASRAGRSRWVALAEGLGKPQATDAIKAVLESEQFKHSDSDTRFTLIFNAVLRPSAMAPKKVRAWSTPKGKKAAIIRQESGRTALIFDERLVPTFGEYVADQLDRLYAQFSETTGGGKLDK
ncbi:plasmid partitioning protein RepB [Sinorhizobium medicae]|nr:plasmid partitioning protein RepB [Sinorhizobium medicae]MDX0729514.1 plasmid partitioning protein RepB [Sinorhizobium medicae]MDX0735755.1 plasmid partitioning protein RepB [Sinorhizobium medicae]MDX1103837.1 plasmid partitioning protein RepB [Sinorhizobium medicae]MDX1153362.1 plasmid partitioning protein RepB [Sinorhizobium medicae]